MEGIDMAGVQKMQQQQQQAAAMEEQRASILDQILEPGAKDRLSRLALVKKEKARSVEDSLINAARSGKLPGKVTEEQLIVFLEQLSGGGDSNVASSGAGKKKISIQRRNYGMDDDDDDDSDLI